MPIKDRAARNAYQRAHPEYRAFDASERASKWDAAHPDKANARKAKWRKTHRAKQLVMQRAWRHAHRERARKNPISVK